MSIALGLRKPTQGAIRVLTLEPIKDGAKLRSLVSYGPERNILPDEMPAVDFVKHLAEVRGIPRKEAKPASDVLWLVGLGEERFRPIGTMSTGQRQRVKLAQAIAADPQLVFLDEPTDGLDPLARDEVLTLIRQVSEEYGIHIMISSHLLEEVEQICDNIVVLNAGKLVVAGQLNQLTGQSTGIEVELVPIDDQPTAIDAVERSLRQAGLTVTREEDSTVLRIQDGTSETPADLIRDAVAEAGARLHRIQHRRRSSRRYYFGHVLMSATDNARILDRGYRQFDGERLGTRSAIRSTAWQTTRSIFGLGRKARHKFFPMAILGITYLIVIIQLAAVFLFGNETAGFLTTNSWEQVKPGIVMILFAALVAPDAIVRDQKTECSRYTCPHRSPNQRILRRNHSP